MERKYKDTPCMEKIFANCVFDKGLISKNLKNAHKSIKKKTI